MIGYSQFKNTIVSVPTKTSLNRFKLISHHFLEPAAERAVGDLYSNQINIQVAFRRQQGRFYASSYVGPTFKRNVGSKIYLLIGPMTLP